MIDNKKQQVDKETWGKMSFYIDIIVFFIIAICLYLLIQQSYYAGMNHDVSGIRLSQQWFRISGIVGILAVCLTWIFFRLFRYRGQIQQRY